MRTGPRPARAASCAATTPCSPPPPSRAATRTRAAPVAARMALARFLVGSELSLRGHRRAERPGPRPSRAAGRPGVPRPARRRPRHGPPLQGGRGRLLLAGPGRRPVERALARPISPPSWPSGPRPAPSSRKGAEAFGQFPPAWKARFARADAQAALAQGDLRGRRRPHPPGAGGQVRRLGDSWPPAWSRPGSSSCRASRTGRCGSMPRSPTVPIEFARRRRPCCAPPRSG